MEWNDFTSLTAENMQAIWDFKTKDPFSILGIHPLETDRGIKTVIRTYQPQASFVRGESCDGTEEFDFVKLGNTGFFEAILDLEYKPFFSTRSAPASLSTATGCGCARLSRTLRRTPPSIHRAGRCGYTLTVTP